ncbi:MAG: MerR family DNA-binding transcriptional regulator [Planctomycetes bacterium]|nr:MerR family DNA-binding transcriptional regulator [Planctomycetota bacterium]
MGKKAKKPDEHSSDKPIESKKTGKSKSINNINKFIPEKLYTTGDIMQFTGLGRQTLHTYRQLGLIIPAKRNDKGRWFYDISIFERIKRILRWQRHRALTEVAKILTQYDKKKNSKQLGIMPKENEEPKIDDPLHPPKFYTIGEIIQITGLTRQVIHNYIVQGLISEVGRTKSGHRLFNEVVFERIKMITRYKEHRTLDEVKKILDISFKKKNM